MLAKKKHFKFLIVLLPLLGLAGLWQFTPLQEYMSPQAMVTFFRKTFSGGTAVSPYIAVVVFSVAGFLMISVNALILATALLFPFWQGIAVSFMGMLISCTFGYLLGRVIGPDTLQKIFGKKFEQAFINIGRKSIMAVVSLRILPVAPFGVINVVFGNLRIRFVHYLLGTIIGMSPGIIVINYFGRAVTRIMEDPSIMSAAIGIGVLILIVTLIIATKKMHKKHEPISRRNFQDAR